MINYDNNMFNILMIMIEVFDICMRYIDEIFMIMSSYMSIQEI